MGAALNEAIPGGATTGGTIITIVRHGNTFAPGETATRIGARTDIPLVASGIAQARALGRHFAATRFDRVLASPLRRTRQTAELILNDQTAPPPIETAAFLAEIDHGPDEGLADAAIVARIGAAALAGWDDAGIPPADWQVDPAARIAAWNGLFDEAAARPGENWLIVTSNGAARFALLARATPHVAALPSLKLRTGAWGLLRVDGPNPHVTLEAWNRRAD